jgi:hypothetical protein
MAMTADLSTFADSLGHTASRFCDSFDLPRCVRILFQRFLEQFAAAQDYIQIII